MARPIFITEVHEFHVRREVIGEQEGQEEGQASKEDQVGPHDAGEVKMTLVTPCSRRRTPANYAPCYGYSHLFLPSCFQLPRGGTGTNGPGHRNLPRLFSLGPQAAVCLYFIVIVSRMIPGLLHSVPILQVAFFRQQRDSSDSQVSDIPSCGPTSTPLRQGRPTHVGLAVGPCFMGLSAAPRT